jgi:hypothetical protein
MASIFDALARSQENEVSEFANSIGVRILGQRHHSEPEWRQEWQSRRDAPAVDRIIPTVDQWKNMTRTQLYRVLEEFQSARDAALRDTFRAVEDRDAAIRPKVDTIGLARKAEWRAGWHAGWLAARDACANLAEVMMVDLPEQLMVARGAIQSLQARMRALVPREPQ